MHRANPHQGLTRQNKPNMHTRPHQGKDDDTKDKFYKLLDQTYDQYDIKIILSD